MLRQAGSCLLSQMADLKPRMNIPPNINTFWEAFEAASGRDMKSRFDAAFHFDDNGASPNELAQLVLFRTKSATAALQWSMDADNKPLYKPGEFSVVIDWGGRCA